MKVGFFITARLKSSRLKKKIILPLNGLTVLDQVIERCKKVNGIDGVVLCTSTNPQDEELYGYAQKHGIDFYAGSEDDVLQRLLDASKEFRYDAFLSITADNPLHSIHISNLIMDWVSKKHKDFVFTTGMPIGLTPYYIHAKALEIAVAMKEQSETEIWGPFVNRPDFFKVGYLTIETDMFNAKTRLTCDYREDYDLFMKIFAHFPENYYPSIFEVADLFRQNKVYISNKSVQQTMVPDEVIKQIRDIFDTYKDKGRKVAQRIGYIPNPGEEKLTIKL